MTLSKTAQMIKESGRTIVGSVSGGKDSLAMALYLKENGFEETNEIHWVFCDTGWEHPELYRYIDEVVEPLLGENFHRLRSKRFPGGMIDMIRKKKTFPTRISRFCTSELKIEPVKAFLKELRDKGHDPINAVGIRAQESYRRSMMDEWDEQGPMKVDTWRPLISWVIEEVIEIHHRHSVLPVSLYYKKENPVKRVGCWPCIMSSKAEIVGFAADDPDKVRAIAELEDEVGDLVHIKAQEKKAAAGKPYNAGDIIGATFFTSSKKPYPTKINEAIAWAKTARGGRQYQLFTAQDPADRGCGMWGLCDIADEDGEFTP